MTTHQQFPTYDQVDTAVTVSREVEQERDKGILDKQYIKGIPGLLKLIQASFSLIAFICVSAAAVVCIPYVAVTGYFSFVTMAAMILALILYVLHLFKLRQRIFRCDCCKWPLIEAGIYGVTLVFYFFGDLFLSIQGCHPAHKAAVAFGWLAFFAFCVDGFFAGREFLRWRQGSGRSPSEGDNGGTSRGKY